MFKQISRIRVTTKKPSQQEQTFFLQSSSLFLRTSVSGLLHKESMTKVFKVMAANIFPNMFENFAKY